MGGLNMCLKWVVRVLFLWGLNEFIRNIIKEDLGIDY